MGVTHINECQADTETTFATTAAGAPVHLRLVEGTFKPRTQQVVLPDMSAQNRLHQFQQHRHGSQFGSGFDASFYLDGLAAALDTAASFAQPENNISVPLLGLMGGVSGAAGSTVSGAGATTTVIPVQAGHGSRFTKGGAVVIGGEMREIKNVATDDVTLKMALSAAPGDTTAVYNCVTFYLDEDNVGGDGDSLQFLFDGPLTNDAWLFQGCGGTFSLTMGIDALVQMAVSIQAAKWTKQAAALSAPSYVGGGPLPAKAGALWWQAVGTTTRNVLSLDTFSVDPGLSVVPERCLDGVETVKRWRMMRAATKASFTAYAYENFDEFWTHFADATTKRAFLLQVGNTPIVAGVGTGVVGISLPCAQYASAPERVDHNGLIGATVNLDAREDEDVTTATTDQHLSKLRIHCA